MFRLNQVLAIIRAAVVLTSVSVMTLGSVGITQAAAQSAHTSAHSANASSNQNERWG